MQPSVPCTPSCNVSNSILSVGLLWSNFPCSVIQLWPSEMVPFPLTLAHLHHCPISLLCAHCIWSTGGKTFPGPSRSCSCAAAAVLPTFVLSLPSLFLYTLQALSIHVPTSLTWLPPFCASLGEHKDNLALISQRPWEVQTRPADMEREGKMWTGRL